MIYGRRIDDSGKLAVWQRKISGNIYGAVYNNHLEIYEKDIMKNFIGNSLNDWSDWDMHGEQIRMY